MNFNKYKNIKNDYDVDFFKFKNKKNLKKLVLGKSKAMGKSHGTIVSWHRGGGVKRNFRVLFDNKNIEKTYGILRSIEYDPNRTTFIGTVQFQDGSFSTIVVNSEMKVGSVIAISKDSFDFNKQGDFLKLRFAPIGIPLYNIEKNPGSGPVYSKAAGVFSLLLSKDLNYGKIRLPSKEERLFDLDCLVTLGRSSNIYNKFHNKYKAGTNRLLNRRPIVRGVAMNPIDHPHGGGEGKTSAGRPSVSPWGKLTKGVPTRNRNLKNKFILKK